MTQTSLQPLAKAVVMHRFAQRTSHSLVPFQYRRVVYIIASIVVALVVFEGVYLLSGTVRSGPVFHHLDFNSTLTQEEFLSDFKRNPQPGVPIPPELNMKELLALPEREDVPETKDWVAIVGMFRRPEVVKRLCDSMLNQKLRPSAMWAVMWNAPKEKEILHEIEEWRKENEEHRKWLKVIVGDPDLKYWGRFQVALQVHDPYVVIFDDDCIPQTNFVDFSLHILRTEHYRGLLGLKGHPGDKPQLVGEKFGYWGPVSKQKVIKEADVVGGAWILETQWLRVTYREHPWTWDTGEDFNMCHNLRKYANLRSFVLPHDEDYPDYLGVTPDYLDISNSADTTGPFGLMPKRFELSQWLYRRGTGRIGSEARWNEVSVMVFVDSYYHALKLVDVAKLVSGLTLTPSKETKCESESEAKAKAKSSAVVSFLFSGGPDCGDDGMRKIMGDEMYNNLWNDFRIFNVSGYGAHPWRDTRTIDMMSDALYATHMAILSQGPAFMVVPADGSPSALAVAMSAQHSHIPVICLKHADSRLGEDGYWGAVARTNAKMIEQMSVLSTSDPCAIAEYISKHVNIAK